MSEDVPFGELPHRAVYRVRPEEETENAIVEIEGCAETRQVRLRSISSINDAVITFRNMTDRAVRVVWLDFDGNEVVYSIIQPRETRRYRTFTTHPWIVRAVDDQMRMMINSSQAIFGTEEEQIAEIQEPPLLPWTESTHRFFPEEFRAAVRCVLLCHHRLRHHGQLQSHETMNNGTQRLSLMRMGINFFTRSSSFGQRTQRQKQDSESTSGAPSSMQCGLSLGDLPRELVSLIIQKMETPDIFQDLVNGEEAAPDVKAVKLPPDVDVTKFLSEDIMNDEE